MLNILISHSHKARDARRATAKTKPLFVYPAVVVVVVPAAGVVVVAVPAGGVVVVVVAVL